MFVVVIGGFFATISFYVGVALFGPRAPLRRWRTAGGLWLGLGVLVFLAQLGVAWRWPVTPGLRAFSWLGWFHFGLVNVLFGAFLLVSLARLVVGAAGLLGAPVDPVRRFLLSDGLRLTAAGAAGALSLGGAATTVVAPRVLEHDVPLDGLPPELDGFRIVQLSDLHVGPTIGGGWLGAVVATVNELSPDLVALTGDVIDGDADNFVTDVAPFADLQAPHGCFLVTGNHEYYSGVDAWVERFRSLGLEVLLNEHRVVSVGAARLVLAGVTDYSAGRMRADHAPDADRAMAGAPDHDVRVLLAHQPRSYFASKAHAFDLQLSGHTHGGQHWPFTWMIGFAQPFVRGLQRVESTWLYVSRGTGYWGPPNRAGELSEITVLTLRPGAARG